MDPCLTFTDDFTSGGMIFVLLQQSVLTGSVPFFHYIFIRLIPFFHFDFLLLIPFFNKNSNPS